MTPGLFAKIADSLTVHSRQAGINPATASRDVLLSLPNATPEMVDAYLAQRKDALANKLPRAAVSAAPRDSASAPLAVWRIRAEATMPDGVTFVREAVLRASRERAAAVDRRCCGRRARGRLRRSQPASEHGEAASARRVPMEHALANFRQALRELRGDARVCPRSGAGGWPSSRRSSRRRRGPPCSGAGCARSSRSATTSPCCGSRAWSTARSLLAEAARIPLAQRRRRHRAGRPRALIEALPVAWRRVGAAKIVVALPRSQVLRKQLDAAGRGRGEPARRRSPTISIGTRRFAPINSISMPRDRPRSRQEGDPRRLGGGVEDGGRRRRAAMPKAGARRSSASRPEAPQRRLRDRRAACEMVEAQPAAGRASGPTPCSGGGWQFLAAGWRCSASPRWSRSRCRSGRSAIT